MKKIVLKNEKLVYYVGIILLICLCIIFSLHDFENILNDNMDLLQTNTTILNSNMSFIKIITVISQILAGFFSVFIDAIIAYFVTLLVYKKKIRIKVFKLPMVYGTIVAMIVNRITMFSVSNLQLSTLKRVNLLPFGLVAKGIIIYVLLINIIEEKISKRKVILIVFIFSLISYLFTLVNVFSIN